MIRIPIDRTNYHYVDPTGTGRNWAMIWVGVDSWGRRFVYREWPCSTIPVPGHGYPGPWAEVGQNRSHKVGGIPGAGSKSFGFGLLDYKNEVARLEGWDDVRSDLPVQEWLQRNGSLEKIYCRYIDKRFANTGRTNATGEVTLLDELGDVGLDFIPITGHGAQDGTKAIDHGVDLINDMLRFEDGWETEPDPLHMIEKGPKLFISEECQNVWFALKNYTGAGGAKEACKDWIDLLRYMAHSDPHYVTFNRAEQIRGGYGGGVNGGANAWGDAKRKKLIENREKIPWKK